MMANIQGRCKKGEGICSAHIYINCVHTSLAFFCMKSATLLEDTVILPSLPKTSIICVFRAFVCGPMVKGFEQRSNESATLNILGIKQNKKKQCTNSSMT